MSSTSSAEAHSSGPADAQAPETSPTLPLIDQHPDSDSFREDVVQGLQQTPKSIPSKYLYDERGSKLFDEICRLDEYYLTRTEMEIMDAHVSDMAEKVGRNVRLVEYGSGSSWKTRILLDALTDVTTYVPIDISRDHLLAAARDLAEDYPDLPVQPVCADYTTDFDLPDAPEAAERTVVYYPGSTIGNFRPDQALSFLEHVAEIAGPGGGLVIGVDLRKSPDVLVPAYDDADGITQEFNLNLLDRMNRELDATFDRDRFGYTAEWDPDRSCIDMQLISQEAQQVQVDGVGISFEAGESIHTEYSFKYTLDAFADLAGTAGLEVDTVWTDDDELFSIQYCTVRS
jgi:dimethylhistidine N-methyltransferase